MTYKTDDTVDFLHSLSTFVWEYRYLTVIFFLSIFLHIFQLGSNPPVVFTDEIDPFVSSLSLLQGHGVQLAINPYQPLNLIVITLNGEWESLSVFGPTTFAIRFPGVIYSSILLFSTYLLAKKLFDNMHANWAAFLVSISPLIVQGSRVFYQIPIVGSVALMAFASYLYISSINKRPDFVKICLASSFLAFDIAGFLNIYARLPAVIILISLIAMGISYHKKNLTVYKLMFYAVLPIEIVLLIVLIPAALSPSSVFASIHTPSFYFNPSQNLLLQGGSGVLAFMTKYITYFSPQFLFFVGDPNPTQNTGLTGEMLYPGIIFFYVGLCLVIYRFLKVPKNRFGNGFLLLWILVGPIEGASAVIVNYTDSSNALLMTPALQIITAIGVIATVQKIQSLLMRKEAKKEQKESMNIYSIAQVGRSGEPRSKKVLAISVAVLIIYSASGLYFGYAYFYAHPIEVEDIPPTWADWGYLYGFPQIAEYLATSNYSTYPLYISPDGMFGGNISNFNYFYNIQHIPETYLDYYSNGKISKTAGVVNVSDFYSPIPSLILSGACSDVNTLKSMGIEAHVVHKILRPNGIPALVLIETSPSLQPKFLNEMSKFITKGNNITKQETVANKSLLSINKQFSFMVDFSIMDLNYSPNEFYCLAYSVPIPGGAPSFGLRLSTLSYSPSGGSLQKMTLNGFLYSTNRNYSTQPGAFAQVWSQTIIKPSLSYTAVMVFGNQSYTLYVNGTRVSNGELTFPLAPLSGNLSFDENANFSIYQFYVWNLSLNAAQVGSAYFNGVP